MLLVKTFIVEFSLHWLIGQSPHTRRCYSTNSLWYDLDIKVFDADDETICISPFLQSRPSVSSTSSSSTRFHGSGDSIPPFGNLISPCLQGETLIVWLAHIWLIQVSTDRVTKNLSVPPEYLWSPNRASGKDYCAQSLLRLGSLLVQVLVSLMMAVAYIFIFQSLNCLQIKACMTYRGKFFFWGITWPARFWCE